MAGLNIFKNFATDEKVEENGKEIQIGDTSFITVAREGNKRYQRMFTKLYEASQFVLKQKNDAAEVRAVEITIEVMAHTILLGWRGMDAPDDSPDMPYSIENAKLLLAVKDFRKMVDGYSKDFANFKAAEEVETAKN